MKSHYQMIQELREDFETEWNRNKSDMRKGQAAFNTLMDHFESVAERIVGTDADPFYKDDRLEFFWQRAQEIDKEIEHETRGN